ncbi:carbohydrate-binding protein [Alicyclobacillus tolerans]|uniref:GH36-type glycosyl hydrolase domain-containing protein n=1 Tax=Alicyclobacillus tolerans TaxID=90970 RepID=UPI001F362FEC|nr:glucoamylase family protein [Alicyclobacillus tolerans]MCF8564269.1 carbohydrate-binding protein [Alicyclobacillus tolerans]
MILNNEQLKAQAREFAMTNELRRNHGRAAKFWPAFRADMDSLRSFAEQLTHSRAQCMQPAEDWLLDHIAFIETQAHEVFRQLPRETLHKLPKLRDTGMPRIYAICEDYLDSVDGHYKMQTFEIYLESYQEVSVLKTAECWLLPSAMRVVIIRRLAQVLREVRERHETCRWVTSLLGRVGAKHMSDAQVRALLERESRDHSFTTSQVVHLVQHLSELEPNIHMVQEWLAAHVENSESSLAQMVSFEHELQAELQVTSGHLVTSLHLVERHPWRSAFVKISHVEQILLSEESGEYRKMDFASRDLLRNRVSEMAQRLNVPETLVAQNAVKLARRSQERVQALSDPALLDPIPPRDACLAYYVLDPHGIFALRKQLSQIARPRHLPKLAIRRRPLSAYLSSAAIVFVLLLWLTGTWVTAGTAIGPWARLAVLAALVFPVSEWVVAVVHAAIQRCCQPSALVRYDFSDGLPKEAKTMVTMPIIWASTEEVDDVMERLEVHYLANRQENIHFAVLADFPDAATEALESDNAIVSRAVARIQALQEKYGTHRFFLFHRARRYNPIDNVYMGWERKRGKLVEFVELLKGRQETSFTTVYGNRDILREIRYVFTIDHDTQLPIGVVSRMAGTLHFPFNRPRLNKTQTRVVEGYGVLQPRIGVSYESTQKSRFAALWAGEPGIDPYAFAVSNPYQDLFGKAIFVGKGIFDVDAFAKILVDRIPDNHVLSHDLLEGGFLRTGLTSDIEVVEEYPSSFLAHQRRAHRWIRGDWQLIKWLGKSCIDRYGDRKRVDLCGLTRWQIADNLRRSLVPVALFVTAVLGMGVLPGNEWAWETLVLATVFLPFLKAFGRSVTGRARLSPILSGFGQSVVQLLTLPFHAVNAADAILRSLYRMLISRKRLLEWVPAKQTNRKPNNKQVFALEPIGYLAALAFVAVAFSSGTAPNRILGICALVLWLWARFGIQLLNRAPKVVRMTWLESARPELKALARQIWSFYDRYVTVSESWLPPDNVQYHPQETVAHRTSPTNIGLYLASVAAARELGFIDTPQLLNRVEATLRTVQRMEKWHGHLYNWYDTLSAQPLKPRYVSTVDSGNFVSYLMVVRQALADAMSGEAAQASENSRIQQLMSDMDELIEQTNFCELYNPDDRLFCLGYHADEDRREVVLYDLLASEARQTSFVAIALGQVPVSHWFTLGRTMTVAGGQKTLLSWSGTMFEYMMPALTMRTYPNTVWDSTYQGVVLRQQQYAEAHKVPFGISESGYYAFDHQLNYQYRAFGVPGLGLDRGLERHLVIAPYATVMALPYAGEAGVAALRKLGDYGTSGPYGYYEAVDFTVSRLPAGSRYKVIESFMAHHQAMSLLTLTNLLENNVMIDRFHADPRVKAANLLLQERIPVKAAIVKEPIGAHARLPEFDTAMDDAERVFVQTAAVPEVNVLSNGRLTSVTTVDGTGFLKWKGLSVTRWREDPVDDTAGMIVYLHDAASERTWSATRHPSRALQDTKTVFHLDKSKYLGTHLDISSKLEVTVPPDLDAEVRCLTLVNSGTEERLLEVTTFLELALASQAADAAHPAFSKLFIQTSQDDASQSLLAKRRPRDEKESETWAVHTVYVDGEEAGDYEFETDRGAFIGRGYSLAQPKGLRTRLKGSTGSVADPAFAMRRTVHLNPQQTVRVYIVTGVAPTKEEAIRLVSQLKEPHQADRAFHLAWVRTQIDLRQLHLSPAQAAMAHHLAGRLLYTPPLSNVRRQAISRNALGPSSLWSRGLSGDVPIAAVSVHHLADLPFVTLLASQHQYLHKLGLELDLVVLDETTGGYQDELMHRLRENLTARGLGEMKRIVGLKASGLSDAERTLLTAVSRVWLRAGGPSLRAQLQLDKGDLGQKDGLQTPVGAATRMASAVAKREYLAPASQRAAKPRKSALETHSGGPEAGEFFNGWGSFVDEGKAYEVQVQSGAYLPRPWSNVIANPRFGCLLTELGTGYSWWKNSRECKVTPWNNDPVLDPPGEVLYLRDEETQEVWSAAPKPCGGQRTYKVVHGWGFTRIEQSGGDIAHEMETTVPLEDPLKVIQLRLRNQTDRTKRISVTYYAEWVLGVTREGQAPFVVTEWDPDDAVLLAHNTYQESFRDAVAFLHIAESAPSLGEQADADATVEHAADGTAAGAQRLVRLTYCSFTADRTEFIGYGGTLASPQGLHSESLSGRTGALANPCGAIQTAVEIPARAEAAVTLLLGCTGSKEEVHALVKRYSQPGAYDETKRQVARFWSDTSGKVQVQTPDRAMDVMLNGWLLYQALSCRLWARTAFYQAGGAFGFRDQLQDSLAFLHADPELTKRQILINAAHQYEQGDVQHWWHEETHKGIRTRFSDDLLWLPYAVARYLEQTGDADILQEVVPYLHSDVLKAGELERYENTVLSDESATVLDHCLRAIRHGLKFGEHGIPLMGIGDWNDGMNRVGSKGRGESVWLGWFLLYILKRFEQILRACGVDGPLTSEHLEQTARQLEEHLNEFAWDGAWFRRAFTDDGKWLGSIEDRECRIDAIAQSWSVIAEGTSVERQSRAMRSFDRELVDRELGVAKLLTKAFDEIRPRAGYIQGYPPGIRENGGQYTHGVIWSIVAWAMLGRRDKTFELFSMLNPISHTQTMREVQTYGNEPYVMSADVYTAEPHQGRAGWSWYTGAAGWMYQAGLEYVLGVKCREDRLYIHPCVPPDWKSFHVDYRYGEAAYSIEVELNEEGVGEAKEEGRVLPVWIVDGEERIGTDHLHLVDDGKPHEVTVRTYREPLSTVG